MDGDIRPDCKRDSWERKKERALDEINATYSRFKAMEMSAKFENESCKQSETKKELELYSKEAKTLEKK